jgi:hypothetical protein
MMSLQELADRLEIEQLIVRYSNSIDQRNWDGLDEVFTPDAYIDYRKLGGIDGRYPQVKAWLGPALANFPHYCHLVGNIEITLAGDHASARTLCINPMDTPLPAAARRSCSWASGTRISSSARPRAGACVSALKRAASSTTSRHTWPSRRPERDNRCRTRFVNQSSRPNGLRDSGRLHPRNVLVAFPAS